MMEAAFGELYNKVDVTNEDFEAAFADFDRAGTGAISKAEMADFIRQTAGLGKGAKPIFGTA